MSAEKWAFSADYIETCNCTHGCPCNFTGIPTDGFCEAIVAYRIRSGHYGNIDLDGLDFVVAWAWPNAIHEGNGTAAFFITERASTEQRAAMAEIVTGRASGQGPFEIFASTCTTMHEPQYTPIELLIDGHKSWFKVPDTLDVQLQNFTEPWNNDAPATQTVKISFDKPGMIFDWAYAAMTKAMRIFGGGLHFDHSGRNAFYTFVEYREQ